MTASATAPKTQATPAPTHPVKAAKFAETDVVTLLAEKNPKRAASAKRFACYGTKKGDTITVGAYLTACEALHPDEPKYRWRADLAWDLQRGFIAIAPAAK